MNTDDCTGCDKKQPTMEECFDCTGPEVGEAERQVQSALTKLLEAMLQKTKRFNSAMRTGNGTGLLTDMQHEKLKGHRKAVREMKQLIKDGF